MCERCELRLEFCNEDKCALLAVETAEGIDTGEGLQQFVPGLGLRRRIESDNWTKACSGDERVPVSIGQDAIMSDLDEARWQDVLQNSARHCKRA